MKSLYINKMREKEIYNKNENISKQDDNEDISELKYKCINY